MTMLDPRPWAPASPHIGPDDEDLACLTPTGDANDDLGSAVLVVHRVGAAACEAVARAPLPDEYRLIEALASAREGAATPVVGAIAKCVSGPRYADLLLRDLFDEAELGALTVYKACVSKGVAPPLAAQRAGLAYGVPKEAIGPYLAIATNPKSHPVAIADAADRAIVKWASGVVRAEATDEVSKQRTAEQTYQQYNQTVVGREHPKDPRGRFATQVLDRPAMPTAEQVAPPTSRWAKPGELARQRAMGQGGQAAPEVQGPRFALASAEEPVVITATEPPRVTPKRKIRRMRKIRRVRTPQTTSTPARLRLQSSIKTSASLGSAVEAKINAQIGRPVTGIPDLTEKHDPYPEKFGSIPSQYTLGWVMTGAQARALFDAAPGVDRLKHTEIGNLTNPAVLGEPMRHDHDDHQKAMYELAEKEGSGWPRYETIDGWELAQWFNEQGIDPVHDDPKAVENSVRVYAQQEGYYDMVSIEPGGGWVEGDVDKYVSVAPSAEPGNEDWYVIREVPPAPYQDVPDQPIAAEFVMWNDHGEIRGNVEGGGDYPQFELDPSQQFRLDPMRRLWKPISDVRGYWVHRYNLDPIPDETPPTGEAAKADVALGDRPPTRWQTEARDELGRWTATGALVPKATPRFALAEPAPVIAPPVPDETPAQVRRRRKMRRVRRLPQVAQAGTVSRPGVRAQVQSRLNPRAARALRQAINARIESHPKAPPVTEMPPLDERKIHHLFTQTEWNNWLAAHHINRFVDDHRPFELHGMARTDFITREPIGGEQVYTDMRQNLINEVTAQREPEYETDLSRRIPFNDHRAWMDFAGDMESYLAAHHDVVQLRFESDDLDPEFTRVYANAEPVAPQVLIHLPEEGLDRSRPIRLTHLGRARRDQLLRGQLKGEDAARHWSLPIDPVADVWRIDQDLWAASQSPQDER